MALAGTLAINNAVAGIFSATAPTPSTTASWLSLHTATPGTTGASENAATGGYARPQFPVSAAGVPAAGSVNNTAAITITTTGATAVTHVGTFDAVTAGNFRIGAALNSAVTAATITFAIGAIQFSAA